MRKHLQIGLLAMLGISSYSGRVPYNEADLAKFLMEYLGLKYRNHQIDEVLYVAARSQKMYHIRGGQVIDIYAVSTSRHGIGSVAGTHCTPSGLHKVAEKVGHGLPLMAEMKNKTATGRLAPVYTEATSTGEDWITSRLLHLKGMEAGVNLHGKNDTYRRGIFIHGTHEEGLLGTPASKGCIRMGNADIVALFEKVEVGTFVVILNN